MSVQMHVLEDALSLERFARYLAWADGDRRKALDLYTLNAKLSESLYIPLQVLELSLGEEEARRTLNDVVVELARASAASSRWPVEGQGLNPSATMICTSGFLIPFSFTSCRLCSLRTRPKSGRSKNSSFFVAFV